MSQKDDLAEMLADGLDLCVRARSLDQTIETISPDHPENTAGHDITRVKCLTPHIWVKDQYDKDLERWETDARALLTKLGFCK